MHCSTQGASLLPAAARIRHSNVHAPLRVVARSHSLAQRKRAAARHTLAASANIQERAQSATDEEQDHQSESLNEVPSPAAHEGILPAPTSVRLIRVKERFFCSLLKPDAWIPHAQQAMHRRIPAQAALRVRSTEMEKTATEQDRGESSSSTEAEARLSGHSQW